MKGKPKVKSKGKKPSSEYERITSEILQPIYKRSHGWAPETSIRHGQNSKWKGASGFTHQIDVSIDGPHRALLVECKHYKKVITAAHILVFIARVHDIRRANEKKEIHAHFITKTGYSKPFMNLANFYSITCDVMPDVGNFAVEYEGLISSIMRTDTGALGIQGQSPRIVEGTRSR